MRTKAPHYADPIDHEPRNAFNIDAQYALIQTLKIDSIHFVFNDPKPSSEIDRI
jgi:hypothetical protein